MILPLCSSAKSFPSTLQLMNLTHGISAQVKLIWFPLFQSGFTSMRVTSRRRKSGFRFPIPKGLNVSSTLSVFKLTSFGCISHSTVRVLVGSEIESPYFSWNFFPITFWNSSYLDASIVNHAACLCPPYLTKYSLHSSRSSTRLHQSGDRQEATRYALPPAPL